MMDGVGDPINELTPDTGSRHQRLDLEVTHATSRRHLPIQGLHPQSLQRLPDPPGGLEGKCWLSLDPRIPLPPVVIHETRFPAVQKADEMLQAMPIVASDRRFEHFADLARVNVWRHPQKKGFALFQNLHRCLHRLAKTRVAVSTRTVRKLIARRDRFTGWKRRVHRSIRS